MEEILNGVDKLEGYIEAKKELDSKLAEISEKNRQLTEKSKEISINSSSRILPVLEKEKQAMEEEKENLVQDYKTNRDNNASAFNKDKAELMELIKRELSQYKTREEIEQAKKDLEAQKKQAEVEIKQKQEEKEQRKGVLLDTQDKYMELADEAKAAIDRATEDFQAGKNVDQANLKLARDDFEANNKKVEDIDAQIDAIDKDFQAQVGRRTIQLQNYEKEVNSYKAIEDNMAEIRDLEHLRDNIFSMSFENVDKIKENTVILDIKRREAEKEAQQKSEESKQGEDGQRETITSQPTNVNGKMVYGEPALKQQAASLDPDKTAIISEGDQTEISDSSSKEPTQDELENIKPRIESIIIGKNGVTLFYKNTKKGYSKIDRKVMKKISKLDAKGKAKLIEKISNKSQTFSKDALDKMDPNVIYALSKATEDEIPREDLIETMRNYAYALENGTNAQSEIKNLIAYDRTGMDYWRKGTFIDKIRNYGLYKNMTKYMGKAKDFALVIKDKKPESVKEFFQVKKPKFLESGKFKEFGEDTKERLDETGTKIKAIKKIVSETRKKPGKDFLETLKVTQTQISQKIDEINAESVGKIPRGPDLRTPEEKAADEALESGKTKEDGEER